MQNFTKLDKKVVSYWKWTSVPTFSIIVPLGLIYLQKRYLEQYEFITWLLLAYIVYRLLRYSLFLVRGAKFAYSLHGYNMSSDELEYFSGSLFYRTSAIIPMNRVQHASLSQTFVEKKFGLHSLTIVTAGSDCTIEGLSKDQATEMYSLLGQYIKVEDGDVYGD